MDLIADILPAVAGVAFAGLTVLLAARITLRFTEPTEVEVSQAEALASQEWRRTDGILPADGVHESRVDPAQDGGRSGDVQAARILAAYAEDLRGEARRIAKRTGADEPSATHVRLAADRLGILRQRSSALVDIGLGLGGLLIGAASSYMVNIVTGGQENPSAEPWVILIGAGGLVLFVAAATIKWVKR